MTERPTPTPPDLDPRHRALIRVLAKYPLGLTGRELRTRMKFEYFAANGTPSDHDGILEAALDGGRVRQELIGRDVRYVLATTDTTNQDGESHS